MSRLEFKMPKLGESITEATIITWFKNVGDTIEEDEMFLEVSTDKVDSEVPSTVSGVVDEILYKSKDVIKIGEVIALIKTDAKAKTTKKNTNVISSVVEKSPKSKTKPSPENIFTTKQNGNNFFSPLIIAIAKEQHISFEELARIPVTGKKGRLEKKRFVSIHQRRKTI